MISNNAAGTKYIWPWALIGAEGVPITQTCYQISAAFAVLQFAVNDDWGVNIVCGHRSQVLPRRPTRMLEFKGDSWLLADAPDRGSYSSRLGLGQRLQRFDHRLRQADVRLRAARPGVRHWIH